MALVQLPTGRTRRTAAFAYRGGGLDDPRAFTMTAVLVRHPGGDLLLDTGLGRDVHRQLALMPWTFRPSPASSAGARRPSSWRRPGTTCAACAACS